MGLHRLRLEGELTEIRAADLRFSLDESQALFESAGVELSESGVALLAERTEGWAAGLRLAALSMAGHHDPERFAAAFAGSERTVAEYLVAEVLDRQPERVRRLLLRTSVLEQGQRAAGRFVDGRLRRATDPAGVGGGGGVCGLAEHGADPGFGITPYSLTCCNSSSGGPQRTNCPRYTARPPSGFLNTATRLRRSGTLQAAEEWILACRLLSDNWFGLILSWSKGHGPSAPCRLPGQRCSYRC